MKTRIGLKVSLVWVLAFSIILLISPYSINAQNDIGPLLQEDLLISDSQILFLQAEKFLPQECYMLLIQIDKPFEML